MKKLTILLLLTVMAVAVLPVGTVLAKTVPTRTTIKPCDTNPQPPPPPPPPK